MDKCEICGKVMKSITHTHLKLHELKVVDYLAMFPQAKTSWNKNLKKEDDPRIRGGHKRGMGLGHKPTFSKEVLGEERYNKINELRKTKISQNANLEACSRGGKKGIASRRNKPNFGFTEKGLEGLRESGRKTKGRKAWNAGLTKHTDVRVKNYGINQRKDPNVLQHGIDFSAYGWTKELAQEVRKRDYFTCQLCGKERVTIVHHKNGDRKVNEIDNLITLCRGCHQLVHMERQENGKFKLREIPARISDLKS